MSKPRRSHYSDEFKERSVALSHSTDYSIAEAAQRLGLNRSMLDRWRRQLSDDRQTPDQADDRDAELRRLREENPQLREERTVLKKPRPYSPTSRRALSVHGSGDGPSRSGPDGPSA